MDSTTQGAHQDRHTGSADELLGSTRPWVFGDELPIDAVRTVSNALMRRGSLPVRLDVEDFEVRRDRARSTAAVALCVDLSFSMVQEGRWGPMKQTALALSHLVETRFRQDALQIIGFDRTTTGSAGPLAEAEPEWVQGTNLQHALVLAARHLRRHPDAEPVVMVVTDGEPTAHLTPEGVPYFRWPGTPGARAGHRRPGRPGRPIRRDAELLHARRRPRPGAVRGRHGPPRRRPGVHPRPRHAGRVRRERLPPGPPRRSLSPSDVYPAPGQAVPRPGRSHVRAAGIQVLGDTAALNASAGGATDAMCEASSTTTRSAPGIADAISAHAAGGADRVVGPGRHPAPAR